MGSVLIIIQSNVAVLNLWNHHQENGVLQKVVPSHGLILNPQYQRDNYCWLKSFTSWGGCILIVWSQISAIRPASKTPGLMFYNSFTVSGFLVPSLREKHTSQTLKIQGGLVGPCNKKGFDEALHTGLIIATLSIAISKSIISAFWCMFYTYQDYGKAIWFLMYTERRIKPNRPDKQLAVSSLQACPHRLRVLIVIGQITTQSQPDNHVARHLQVKEWMLLFCCQCQPQVKNLERWLSWYPVKSCLKPTDEAGPEMECTIYIIYINILYCLHLGTSNQTGSLWSWKKAQRNNQPNHARYLHVTYLYPKHWGPKQSTHSHCRQGHC